MHCSATGKPTLPILFIDGKAISDSTTIIETLEGLQPAPPLYPPNRETCKRALELEDFLDEELGPAARTAVVGWAFYNDPKLAIRVLSTGMPKSAQSFIARAIPVFKPFYTWRHKIRPDNIDAARAKVRECLDRIESEIQPSGFLAGDRFSVADLTAAALLAPIVQPKDLEFKPEQDVLDALASYRETVIDHPAGEVGGRNLRAVPLRGGARVGVTVPGDDFGLARHHAATVRSLADRLSAIGGVSAVVLGGSGGRRDERPICPGRRVAATANP